MALHCAVFFRQEVKPGTGFTAKTLDGLRTVKGVREVFPTLGRFDGVCLVEGKDFTECAATAVRINEQPGVRATETQFEVPT